MHNILVWIIVALLGLGTTTLPGIIDRNVDDNFLLYYDSICTDKNDPDSEKESSIEQDNNQNDETSSSNPSQDNSSSGEQSTSIPDIIHPGENNSSNTSDNDSNNSNNQNSSSSAVSSSENTSSNTSKPNNSLPNIDNSSNNSQTGSETDLISLSNQVVQLVNKERVAAGLNPLTVDVKVQEAAQTRAIEIKTSFSHTRPNGSSCFTALKEAGAAYRGAGENIAKGQTSAQQVMNGWMNSQGHRANILNEKYTTIGVGVYKSNGTYYWTQMFTY